MDLVEFLEEHWSVIVAAPWTFLVFGALIGSAALTITSLWHRRTNEHLRERLDDYRERLHLAPAHGSEYAKLTHGELKVEALRFVSKLRDWLATKQAEDGEREHRLWIALSRASDDEQRQRLREQRAANFFLPSKLNQEYDSNFKVKAIVLRDALLGRVKRPTPNIHAEHNYEHPTNPIGMRMVADDLESLARLLR